MITLLTGENDFEVREALKQIVASFNGTAERFDGSDLTLAQLPDILMGVSLFASERLVIIDTISANSSLWEKLPDWLPRIADGIHVVLIEPKPDKRTTGYKTLKAAADVKEFAAWTDRDQSKAEQWLTQRAVQHAVKLDARQVRYIVQRVGVNQWQLASALELLSLLDTITPEQIDAIIPASLSENVFQLFEVALQGNTRQVSRMIEVLSLQEDAYALFALLSSQALTLAAVTFKEEGRDPVKDFAIHPFVASKLSSHGAKLGGAKVARIVELFAKADADLKRSRGEPWVVLEKLLLTI